MIKKLPDFTIRAPAEFRRIGEDDIVAVAATLLAQDELHGVLADPADRRLVEAGERLVLARPADRLLGGVHMGDFGAGSCRDQ